MKTLGGWRGKQFPHRYRIKHVLPRVTDESGLMTGTATCNDTDLAGDGGIFRSNDTRVFREPDDVGMSFDKTLHGIFHDFVRIVDEALHDISCKMNERWAQRMV